MTIPVWLPGVQHEVLLQRAELEELVGPLLQPTVAALGRVVASAGLRPDDLDAVLLVGGSSRIPLIGRQVSAGFGRPVVVDAHPKHPVALGAALDADAHRRVVPTAPPHPPPPRLPAPPSPPPPPPASPVHRELPPLARPRPETTVDVSSRRLLLLASLATPVALVLLIVFTVLRAQDTPTGGTATDGSGSSGATGAAGSAGSGNLLADPTPALEAFAGAYAGGPPRISELVLHPDLAYVDVQVPGEPTHVDEWTWLDGDMTGPEPVSLTSPERDTLESGLFDLSEVDPAILPAATRDMQQNCPGEGLELTHVVVQREPLLDPQGRVLLLVYASNPDRGGGGYIAYAAADGTMVRNMCDPA